MAYGCKCASQTDEWHGWKCSITDGPCEFLTPNSKKCAEEFGEGPDSDSGEEITEEEVVGKCKECLCLVRQKDKIEPYGIYECPNCKHPNSEEDLF